MRGKKLVSVIAIIALIVGVSIAIADSGVVQTEDYGKKSGSGTQDWENQVVKATGIGAINPKAPNLAVARAGCIRAAQVTAQRNLLEIIQGVNIDSETTVENFMLTSDVVKTQVRGVLRGAQIIGQPKYIGDGSCEVIMAVRLTGKMADILLPQDNFGSTEVPQGPQKVYSGLIIDATNLKPNAQPAMAPKVLDEAGNELYGSTYVSRDYAVQMGVVGYSRSVDQAKSNDRIGSNALVLRAIKVSGSKQADVVLSAEDTAKLKDTGIDWSFLKECRVIIVL